MTQLTGERKLIAFFTVFLIISVLTLFGKVTSADFVSLAWKITVGFFGANGFEWFMKSRNGGNNGANSTLS